ncbi:transposase [Parabacteroides sp. PF5-9]|uniref:transposase n=1 Tax=Parabacteroides sp. PF5-9 TaxID=1742404 RepID=UPI00247346B0|nr:transposase [Parabacteroides sp. PF5-9]MDH6359290.1 transposase-like protein [Parabacteroides sp. PF5-9]
MLETKQNGSIRYSRSLKIEITRRYLSESISIRKLSVEYGISFDTVRRYVTQYRSEVLRLFFSNDLSLTRMKKDKDIKSLEKEILRLQEELKLTRIKAEGYEYMLRISGEEYGEDLLKKGVAKQWDISKEDTAE